MTLKDIVTGQQKKEAELPNRGFPLFGIQRDINRIFDEFFRDFNMDFYEERGFSPRLDLTETDTDIIVRIEIPGVVDEEIDISLSEETLTVKGEKRFEKVDKDENPIHMERSYGKFLRIVQLPVKVQDDRAKAEFKNGVLRITLPKTVETRKLTRKIEVKSD